MRRPPYSQWLEAMTEPNYQAIPLGDPQFCRFLVRGLRQQRDLRMRYLCAHHADACADDPRLQAALCARAEDPKEHPVIRGQCLERIHFSPTCRRQAKRLRRLLFLCLRDPDPNVRFWSCFKAQPWTLPILQKMVHDTGVGDLGWTVGYEAGEAIKSIRGLPAWDDDGPKRQPHGYESLWQ
ncbi:MAG: hypothetical protein U0931_27540 [Vulcanimicrobiota bacterium]